MRVITILLVEDNEGIRNNLIHVINKNFTDIELLTASTGKQAIKILMEEKIDLFFLDIQLPDITGMEIAEKIRSMEQYEFSFIVFITAHVFMLKEALQKYNCYDFIEKPFSEGKIIETLNKLRKGMGQKSTQVKKSILIENGVYLHKVYLEDILFIEIEARVLKVHTLSGIMKAQNMSLQKIMNLIEGVECEDFIMTHRSYIVNINKIKTIKQEKKRSWEIHLDGYEEVALLSHKYKSVLFEKI